VGWLPILNNLYPKSNSQWGELGTCPPVEGKKSERKQKRVDRARIAIEYAARELGRVT